MIDTNHLNKPDTDRTTCPNNFCRWIDGIYIGIIDIYAKKQRDFAWTSSAFAQFINSLATKTLTSGGFAVACFNGFLSYGLLKPKWEQKLEC